jgi:hypothetical protein
MSFLDPIKDTINSLVGDDEEDQEPQDEKVQDQIIVEEGASPEDVGGAISQAIEDDAQEEEPPGATDLTGDDKPDASIPGDTDTGSSGGSSGTSAGTDLTGDGEPDASIPPSDQAATDLTGDDKPDASIPGDTDTGSSGGSSGTSAGTDLTGDGEPDASIPPSDQAATDLTGDDKPDASIPPSEQEDVNDPAQEQQADDDLKQLDRNKGVIGQATDVVDEAREGDVQEFGEETAEVGLEVMSLGQTAGEAAGDVADPLTSLLPGPAEDFGRGVVEGTFTLGTQVTGLAIGGTGAAIDIGAEASDDLEGTGEQLAEGLEAVPGEFAEEFTSAEGIGQEVGEEIGEAAVGAVLFGGAGIAAGAVPNFEPEIEPEVKADPETAQQIGGRSEPLELTQDRDALQDLGIPGEQQTSYNLPPQFERTPESVQGVQTDAVQRGPGIEARRPGQGQGPEQVPKTPSREQAVQGPQGDTAEVRSRGLEPDSDPGRADPGSLRGEQEGTGFTREEQEIIRERRGRDDVTLFEDEEGEVRLEAENTASGPMILSSVVPVPVSPETFEPDPEPQVEPEPAGPESDLVDVQPETGQEPDPILDQEPEPEFEQEPEAGIEQEPDQTLDVNTGTRVGPIASVEPDIDTGQRQDPDIDTGQRQQPEPEPEPQPEPEPEPQPEPEPEFEQEPDPFLEPEPEVEPEPSIDPNQDSTDIGFPGSSPADDGSGAPVDTEFTPSLEALVEGFTAEEAPDEITGLEARPITEDFEFPF